MKSAAFDYVRPKDTSEALRVLADGKGEAKFIAGGQSLGPMLNLRLTRPQLLIDISRIHTLTGLEETRDAWSIGAAVTHAMIEDKGRSLAGLAVLSEVAGGIAYRGVRNRGTIGGSLAHADPAADWPLALAALGARVKLRRVNGRTRSLPVEELGSMAFTTHLADDEIIELIQIPKLSAAACFGYFKFCRKTGEFADASAAVLFDAERSVARIFVGALSRTPQPLNHLAEAVARNGLGAMADPERLFEEVRKVDPHLDPIDLQLHVTALRRALHKAIER